MTLTVGDLIKALQRYPSRYRVYCEEHGRMSQERALIDVSTLIGTDTVVLTYSMYGQEHPIKDVQVQK